MHWVQRFLRWFDGPRRMVALVLVGWVVLIVIGAGRRPSGSSGVGFPDLSDALVVILVIGAVLGLVLFPVALWQNSGARKRPPKRSMRGLLVAAAFVVVWSLFAGPPDEPDDVAVEAETVTVQEDPASDGAGRGVGSGEVGALALTVVVALVVLVWAHRRLAPRLRNLGDEPDLWSEAEVASAIDRAADLLLLGDEPRAAVLTAYSSLEQALADCDLPRDVTETPTEHLARVLSAHPAAAGPVVRLGELYELARFSDEPITRADQQVAAQALVRARNDLAAPAGDRT